MPADYSINEEEFFESLKKDAIYERIEMDEFLVPSGYEKNLIRYYNTDYSVWFARSKVKDDESYYYFGLLDEDTVDDIFIELVLKFNDNIQKTNLRFNKGDVLISCKINEDVPEIIDKLPKPYLIGKNGKYYINIGKLGEKTVLGKIEELLRLFDFEVSLEKDFQINTLMEYNQHEIIELTNSPIDLDIIKTNLEVLKLKNYVNEQSFGNDFIEKFNDYLFIKDDDNNSYLNEELSFKSLTLENLFEIIYKTIYELDVDSFEQFIIDFKVNCQKFYSNIQFPHKIDLILSVEDDVVVDSVGDDVVSEDVVSEDVVSEDVVSEDVVSEDVVSEDVVSEDVVSEEVVVDSVGDDVVFEVIPDEWNVDDVDLDEDQQRIFDEFLLLKEDEWVEYESENYNISEDYLEVIFSKVKMDIYLNKITEDDDLEDILIEYFEQFYLDCNSNIMKNNYEKIINSAFYDDLVLHYNFNNEDVEDINYKIKLDIQSKNLDEQDLINRFKIYFESKFSELKYKSDLQKINKETYINEYNLTETEIIDIFNQVISKIEKWYDDLSIFNKPLEFIFKKCLNEKLDLIRSITRKEFEKRYETKEIIINVLGVQNISDDQYNKLIEAIYLDIKRLVIRPEDINDDLLLEYF